MIFRLHNPYDSIFFVAASERIAAATAALIGDGRCGVAIDGTVYGMELYADRLDHFLGADLQSFLGQHYEQICNALESFTIADPEEIEALNGVLHPKEAKAALRALTRVRRRSKTDLCASAWAVADEIRSTRTA